MNICGGCGMSEDSPLPSKVAIRTYGKYAIVGLCRKCGCNVWAKTSALEPKKESAKYDTIGIFCGIGDAQQQLGQYSLAQIKYMQRVQYEKIRSAQMR